MCENDVDGSSAATVGAAARSVKEGETAVFWKLNGMFQPASASQHVCEHVIIKTHTHTQHSLTPPDTNFYK